MNSTSILQMDRRRMTPDRQTYRICHFLQLNEFERFRQGTRSMQRSRFRTIHTNLHLILLLIITIYSLTCLQSISGQSIVLNQKQSQVTLTFPSSNAPLQPLTTFSLAFSAQVKDRWLPQVGPLNLVPTDCVPSANQTLCLGGAGKFSALLQAARQAAASDTNRNETVLFLLTGDWMTGNSFGRSGNGKYEADYTYLFGCDVLGLAAYEFHPELGGNWTIFSQRLQQNFNGLGITGGIADLMLRTVNGTISRASAGFRRRLLNVDVQPAPTSVFPTVLTNVRVHSSLAAFTTPFDILNPPDDTLPGIQSSTIIDYGLDTRAIEDGLCSGLMSSCSNSATGFYGEQARAADAAAANSTAVTSNLNQRLGVLTWTLDDLMELTSLVTLFPDLMKLIYQDSDPTHWAPLLQKEVSGLLDSGINKIVVLLPALDLRYQELVKTVVGIDLVIYSVVGSVYPEYFISETVSGAPILFMSCSPFLLYFCLSRVTFDANGLLVSAQLNTTLLDNSVNGTSTRLHQAITTDYKTIFTNASTTIIGHKYYPPKYATDTSRVRFFETEDGSTAADSGRWIGRTQIGLCNSGAIRAILPQGALSLSKIQAFLPFENNWVKLRVSGNLLWTSFENSVSLSSISNTSDPNYSVSGRGKFLQVSGLRVVWNPLATVGHKIVSLQVAQTASPITDLDTFEGEFNLDTNVPGINTALEAALLQNITYVSIDPDEYYTITIPSFEANNGDGYTFLNHPEATILDQGLNTFQVVFQSYISKYQPSKVTVEKRIVIDQTRFQPMLLSVSPSSGDLTQSYLLTLTGYYLYVGSDASRTKVTFRGPPSLNEFEVDCKVVSTPVDTTGGNITLGTNGLPNQPQIIRCFLSPPQGIDATTNTGVRIFIDTGADVISTSASSSSGLLGAVSFTSLTTPLFNFTAGSASETCASYEGTIFRNGKCVCRGGYFLTNDSSSTSSSAGSPCTACPAGSYSLDEDNVCTLCAPGTFSSTNASTTCTTCPPNTYTAISGATAPISCPANSLTDLNLSPARVRCYCSSGFIATEDLRRLIERNRGIEIDYSNESDTLPIHINSTSDAPYGPAKFYSSNFSCTACLSGGVCDPISGDMRVLSGQWFDAASATFLPCLNPENCCPSGGAVPSGTNFPSDSGSGSCALSSSLTACDAHREGYLCAACESGYQNQLKSVLTGSSTSGSSASTSSSSASSTALATTDSSPTICVACTKPNPGILVLLALIGLIYLSFVMFNTPGKSDYTKILVDFYQMCALVLVPGILTAGTTDSSYFQLFHLRVDIAVGSSSSSGTCIVPISSLSNMVLHAIIGPMLFVSLCVIGLVCWLVTLCVKSIRPTFPWWRFRMASWQLLLFGFMGTISGAFNLLHCKTVGDKSLLVESPDVECWQGSHTIVAVISIIVVVLLCLIVPVTIVMFVRRLRLRLKSAFLFEQLKANELNFSIAHDMNPAQKQQPVTDISTVSRNTVNESPHHDRNLSLHAPQSPSHPTRNLEVPVSPSSARLAGGLHPSISSLPTADSANDLSILTHTPHRQRSDMTMDEISIPPSPSPSAPPPPEKLDMEKVARRIYRKSGIVSMVRRSSALLTKGVGTPRGSSKQPVQGGRLAHRPSSAGAGSEDEGASSFADIVSPIPLREGGTVAVVKPDALADRALNDYGNPLARFRHYAASSDVNSRISMEELMHDADLELTPFELLLLSHGILFLAYKKGWRWFEGAFLIRRVLFALPYAVTDQATAIIISGWFCSAMFLFHSMVDIFAIKATHRLHNSTLICIISLCWLQSSPSFRGPFWIHLIAWLLVLTPFIIAVTTHPWTAFIRRACLRKCCCCFTQKDEARRRAQEEAQVEKHATKKMGEKRKSSNLQPIPSAVTPNLSGFHGGGGGPGGPNSPEKTTRTMSHPPPVKISRDPHPSNASSSPSTMDDQLPFQGEIIVTPVVGGSTTIGIKSYDSAPTVMSQAAIEMVSGVFGAKMIDPPLFEESEIHTTTNSDLPVVKDADLERQQLAAVTAQWKNAVDDPVEPPQIIRPKSSKSPNKSPNSKHIRLKPSPSLTSATTTSVPPTIYNSSVSGSGLRPSSSASISTTDSSPIPPPHLLPFLTTFPASTTTLTYPLDSPIRSSSNGSDSESSRGVSPVTKLRVIPMTTSVATSIPQHLNPPSATNISSGGSENGGSRSRSRVHIRVTPRLATDAPVTTSAQVSPSHASTTVAVVTAEL